MAARIAAPLGEGRMISMSEWRRSCSRVICNLIEAASTMTGPLQMDVDCNVGRQCTKQRLFRAKHIARRAGIVIDGLLKELEELE